MRTFLTIVWHFPFFGFMQALLFLVVGMLQCLTIIFIPLGLGFIQIGLFLFNPFHKELIDKDDLVYINPKAKPTSGFMKVFNIINRVLYFIPGCLSSLSFSLSALATFLTIIGIPTGLVYIRTIPALFNPINKTRVRREDAERIKQIKEEQRFGNFAQSNTTPQASVEVVSPYEDTTSLFWSAAKRYFSIFIYAFVIIEGIIFWNFIFHLVLQGDTSAMLPQNIISHIAIIIAFILVVIKCAKRYIAPIMALTLTNIAFIGVSIYCNSKGLNTYSFYTPINILSLCTPIALAIVAHINKNQAIKTSAFVFMAIAAFNLLWANGAANALFEAVDTIDMLFGIDPSGSMLTRMILSTCIAVVIDLCAILAFAQLIIGLNKEDSENEAILDDATPTADIQA